MKEFENDLVKVWLEDGIALLKFQKNTVLDLEALQQTIAMRENFSLEENRYVLCDITNVKSSTSEARQYGSIHGHSLIYACAVLVDSYITKFLITSYLKFSTPNFPCMFFTDKEIAMNWLHEIKANNKAASTSFHLI